MILNYIDRYKNNLRIRQSISLLTSTLATIPLGIVASIILTNYLGAGDYGNFMFIINLYGFAILIFDFGLFQGGNRALVLNNDSLKSKQYYGVLLLCMFFLFILMTLTLLIFSIFDTNLHSKGLISVFLYSLPFGWLFLLPRFFEGILHADNRIKELAISRLITAGGHLAFYFAAYFFLHSSNHSKLSIIFTLYLFTNLIVFFYLIYKLNPSFKKAKIRMLEVWNYTKYFGFHVYVGSLFGVGMSQVSYILISYFSIENNGVGYFALASAFSSPLKLIPNTIATTYYKEFASMDKIPLKLTIITIAFCVTALIFLFILIPPFVERFYGTDFLPVIKLTYITGIGMMFYGMADYYNRFLGAKGKGILLRNSAIIVGIVILISNILLIPRFAEMGAAFAYLLSGGAYFSAMNFFYKRQIKKVCICQNH